MRNVKRWRTMDKLTNFVNQLKAQGIGYTLEYGVQGTIVHYKGGTRFFAHESKAEPKKQFTVDNPDII